MTPGMDLTVVTPTGVVLESRASKIRTMAPGGAFCILPRHVDFASELVPGLLEFVDGEGAERFLGVNSGTLVKCGGRVLVATRDAVEGTDLSSLRAHVEESFMRLDEQERVAQSALARLEAGIVRRFMDLERDTQ